MKPEIRMISEEWVAVRFSYDAGLVNAVKALGRRKWVAAEKFWQVHLSHLPELREIFGARLAEVDPEIQRVYAELYEGKKLVVMLEGLRGSLSGPGAPVGKIDAATSFPIQGAQYSELYQTGKWDGRKRLFDSSRMTFPTGLWPRIQAVLDEEGVAWELAAKPRAKRTAKANRVETEAPKTPLRDYQAKALKAALKEGRGVLQIATGGGKTLLAAHLIHAIGRPTCFFVHTKELLHQTRAVFERELGVEIGVLGDGLIEPRAITVATIQTAARALGVGGAAAGGDAGGAGGAAGRGKKRGARDADAEGDGAEEKLTAVESRREEIENIVAGAGLVIFDECHHVPADTFYKIAMKARAADKRFGLSATPWRDDGQDLMLEAALGPTIAKASLSDLIHSGYLIPPRIVMRRAPGAKLLGRRRLPYDEVRRTAIVENLGRNRAIAAQAAEWAAAGRSVLILVGLVEHGRALQELLPEARFAHGSLDTETRRRMVDELERKLRPVLIATTLADEGLDIPSLDSLILAGGGRSPTKAYQRLGRALRLWPGKTDAVALDFYDDAPFLAEHSLERLRLYRYEPGFEIRTEGFSG